jgi:shikimate kinase
MRHAVVATGGGTFVDAENRAAINADGVSVWIDVPLADLIPRIPLDGRRPLAADRAQLERLYAARVEAYRAAMLRVSASRLSTSRIVDLILDAIAQMPTVVSQPSPRA